MDSFEFDDPAGDGFEDALVAAEEEREFEEAMSAAVAEAEFSKRPRTTEKRHFYAPVRVTPHRAEMRRVRPWTTARLWRRWYDLEVWLDETNSGTEVVEIMEKQLAIQAEFKRRGLKPPVPKKQEYKKRKVGSHFCK